MKIINVFIVSIIAILGCLVTSCSDDETSLSRAVLASTELLVYDVEPIESQMILVTSDGDWVAEFPEWITVAPSSGKVGQTEVTISVTKNVRDNLPDNPRKAEVLFKGRNLESIARVLVRQNGDKLRDPIDYTIESIANVEDETVVRLPEMTVVALTSNGFIATDGTSFTYVKEPETTVTVGQKVNIVGEKHSDRMHMTYMLGERISDAGTGTLPTVAPFDISSTLDQTEGNVYKYVTVTGDFDGTAITVSGMTNKVYLIDPAAELGVNQLGGHKVTVTGYFAGVAAPVVNVIPTQIEDLGVNEKVFFFDDFSWMENWVSVGNGKGRCADQVGAGNNGGICPQLQSVIYEGKSAYDALLEKGYDFEFMGNQNVVKAGEGAKHCTYLQDTYLKLGKTGYHAGLVLPSIEGVSAGDELLLTFNWCPMVTGSGNFDKTQIVVIVRNGSEETQIPVPPHTLVNKEKMVWQNANISLGGVNIDENTKIIIRNIDSQWPTDPDSSDPALSRFFLDNIKIKLAD